MSNLSYIVISLIAILLTIIVVILLLKQHKNVEVSVGSSKESNKKKQFGFSIKWNDGD